MGSGLDWGDPPSRDSVTFFVERMKEHTRLIGVASESANRHDLTRPDGTILRVFLTDTYTFSQSDCAQLRARHPDVDCIVSVSSWNHFTPEVVREARAESIGTFSIRGLMGALHRQGTAFIDYPNARD